MVNPSPEANKIIILEIGGGDIKAGFDGENGPTVVIPAVVGVLNNRHVYGENAMKLADAQGIQIKRPIVTGEIVQPELLEFLLHYIFY
jgi:actin-related protein